MFSSPKSTSCLHMRLGLLWIPMFAAFSSTPNLNHSGSSHTCIDYDQGRPVDCSSGSATDAMLDRLGRVSFLFALNS
jgi:hypothetical protein